MANKYIYGTEFQSRTMFFMLYPESQQNIIDNIKSSGYEYCGILHDKDIEDDGKLKKPHYHFLIEFSNPKLYSTVCKKLGFDFKKKSDGSGLPVYGEPCRRFKDCQKYLVHIGYEDKYQYPSDELFGSDLLLSRVKSLLSTPDENSQMRLLLDIFDNYGGILTFRTALNLALQYNLYSTFRRGGSLLGKVIEEYQQDRLSSVYDDYVDKASLYRSKLDELYLIEDKKIFKGRVE